MGGASLYEKFFLTTRNGLMFGLLFMCVGELVRRKSSKSILLVMVSFALLCTEITFVGNRVQEGTDRSLYFILPIFCFFFLRLISSWNPLVNTSVIRLSSSAIYVMQFGIITVGLYILNELGWNVWLR